MHKILLPTDGSESSLKAAEYTVELMKLLPDMEVTIFTVEDTQVAGEVVINRTKEVFDQAGLAVKTEVYKGQHVGESFVYYASAVKAGISVDEVGDIIAGFANHGDYDGIIIGRRGINLIQNIFLGSVSEKVIKSARCAVTVVPRKYKKA
jgi:nucleotide-binding universal stress UspA family protein